jgi:hypothetical protein
MHIQNNTTKLLLRAYHTLCHIYKHTLPTDETV